VKSTLISILIILCLSAVYGARSEDDYYVQLKEKAIENISTLPEEVRDNYSRLLDIYPDVFMAFFLAFEESSKLLMTDPDNIVSHHQRVMKLWEDNRENYSLPFFLSYIAKITVTEERITPYRELYADYGLYELLDEYSSKKDLAREINLWTRRYMTFVPTSGRDMAPCDILERCNIGRCEEMQIFFISAARTLGVPARPAMTPLWAHTDNNHAWVEVFVDDSWRYLGAVEPDYELDYAWFTGSASRAVMIMASAAFPDSTDIVLREGNYNSMINSTPNYDAVHTSSRVVEIITVDEEGNPLPKTEIAIMVFNWGMLRSILTAETDERGFYDLITGRGSYFISAANDELYSLHEVPGVSGDYRAEIVLKPQGPGSLRSELQYPDPQLPAREENPDWNKIRRESEEFYNRLISNYQEVSFPEEDPDSLLVEIWDKCRNNKESFLQFYRANSPLSSGFLTFVDNMDAKFLWQASPGQWQNLYNSYQETGELDYPKDILATMLSPTVMYEEIPQRRMKESLLLWREGDIEERIAGMIDYITERYQVDNEKSVQSLLSYDIAMELDYLTNYQYKMLLCSLLRENHIPAAYVRIPDVLAIYTEEKWKYYNIQERQFVSQEEQETGDADRMVIYIVDEYEYPIEISSEQSTLTYREGNIFYPHAEQPDYEAGTMIAQLEPGSYQIQIGYRVDNNLTRYYLEPIEMKEGESVEKTIVLEGYPRYWETASGEILVLLDRLEETEGFCSDSCFIVFGDFDREPIRRIADRLTQAGVKENILWLGSKEGVNVPSYYRVSSHYLDWLAEYPEMKERVITIFYDGEDKKWSLFDGFWEYLPER